MKDLLIIESAIKAFAANGDETTIADVVRIAGIAAGSFYIRWPSRDSILLYIHEQFWKMILEEIVAARKNRFYFSAQEKIRNLVLFIMPGIFEKHKELCLAVKNTSIGDAEHYKEQKSKEERIKISGLKSLCYKELDEIIEEARNEGSLNKRIKSGIMRDILIGSCSALYLGLKSDQSSLDISYSGEEARRGMDRLLKVFITESVQK